MKSGGAAKKPDTPSLGLLESQAVTPKRDVARNLRRYARSDVTGERDGRTQ
jgi:hypothetical protein